MGQPFYAEYAYRNNRVNDYADIINQFVTVARHNYDPKTDLYRHACDVSKREKWADKTTGIVTTFVGDALWDGMQWLVWMYLILYRNTKPDVNLLSKY